MIVIVGLYLIGAFCFTKVVLLLDEELEPEQRTPPTGLFLGGLFWPVVSLLVLLEFARQP